MIGIYKIKNLINHQIYIGQSKNIEKRWQDHKSRAKTENSKFYQALREYGIENFSWEIIEECSQENLDEAEIYWINFYDSYKNGYNSKPGGQFKTTISTENVRAQWDNGLSISEIAQQLGIGTSTVYYELVDYENYSAHESNRRGGVNAYKTKIKNQPIEKNLVFQYDLNGNFIREWASCKEVEDELNISSDSIRRVLNGKRNSAGGFTWSKEKQEKLKNHIVTSIPVAVSKYDLNDNFIEKYDSYGAAARSVGKTDTALIRRVINSNKTAYGFRWKKI